MSDDSSDNSDDDSIVHHGTHSVYQSVSRRTSEAEQDGRVIRIDNDHDGSNKDDGGKGAVDPYRFIGRRVYKEFPPMGWFFGTVTEIHEDVEADDVDYGVVYDDDDNEDMSWDDLKKCLEQWERHKSKDQVWQKKQARERSEQQRKHKAKIATTTTMIGSAPHTPVRVKRESGATAVTPSPKKPRPPIPRFKARDYFDKYLTDIVWIREMGQWLEEESVSKSNGRLILRQVTKLATGEGIDYTKHWPTHVVFLKNIKVDLKHRFDLMDMLAREYEDDFGEDKGHGWLLKHPIKKLRLYQEHIGIVPSVDFTKLPGFVSHVSSVAGAENLLRLGIERVI